MNQPQQHMKNAQNTTSFTQDIISGFKFDDVEFCVSVDDKKVYLTQTEFKLFKYLFDRQGQVITKQELQRNILKKDLGKFDRNLDMHVSNTRKKFVETQLPRTLINTVRGQGYSVS